MDKVLDLPDFQKLIALPVLIQDLYDRGELTKDECKAMLKAISLSCKSM